MGWWWPVLIGVDLVWVFGVSFLLAEGERGVKDGAGSEGVRQPDWWRVAFAWAYYLYHVPLLVWDYLVSGRRGPLLQGRGRWAFLEAACLGGMTVGLYGIALSWFLA